MRTSTYGRTIFATQVGHSNFARSRPARRTGRLPTRSGQMRQISVLLPSQSLFNSALAENEADNVRRSV